MASACARSILSLRKARSLNSPARARRAPSCHDALDQRVDHHIAAMALQLEHVLHR